MKYDSVMTSPKPNVATFAVAAFALGTIACFSQQPSEPPPKPGLSPDLVFLKRAFDEKNDLLLLDGVKKYPNSAALHAALAIHYRTQGSADIKRAEFHYERALEIDPNDAVSHFGYGEILTRPLNRLEDAETHFKIAIKLEPKNGFFVGKYASFFVLMKRNPVEIESTFKRALELDTKDAQTNLFYAGFLMAEGRPKEAELYIKRSLSLNDRESFAHSLYGDVLNEQDDHDGAEREYRKAIELNPENAAAHLNLASILNDIRKHPDLAEHHYRTALILDPTDDEAFDQFATFLTQVQGKHVEAAKHYETAIKLAPQDSAYVGNYSQVLVILKRWDDAEREAARAWELTEDKTDSGAAEIAFTRWLLARRIGANGAPSLARLKTILGNGYKGGDWDFTHMIAAVAPELEFGEKTLAGKLADSIIDEKKIADLMADPIWKETKPIALRNEWK